MDMDILIEDIKKDINKLLSHPDTIPYYMLPSQLEMTLQELDKMREVRNADTFFPYYPKGISDAWDYNDPLGNKLMDLLNVYRKL
ncbi:hypothetical protein NXH64_10565 [Butyrivibrio fibrisolvens]|nr:hypothetical protein [Butyrivibrio fibrisolvens]